MTAIYIPLDVASSPDGKLLIFETEPDCRGFYDEHLNHVSSLRLAQCGSLVDAMQYVKANWPESRQGRVKPDPGG